MQFNVSGKALRFLAYALILFGVPLFAFLVWSIFQLLFPDADQKVFIFFLSALFAIFMTLLIQTSFKSSLTSTRERDLQASREQFVSLYEQSPVPYMTINKKGEVVMYNLATARLFKEDVGSMLGSSLSEKITHEDENDLSFLLGKLTSGATISETETQIVTSTGDRKWVLLSVLASETSHERLVSLVDITHQKLVDVAKSEFVSLATHQLRTPVAAIRWNLELLEKTLKETLTEKQSTYLEKINRNTHRMIALINDFLSVSKLETGTFSTEPEEINLSDFFTGIIDEYTQSITQKKLIVEHTFEPQDLLFVTDTRLLHIIVSNLLSNAVKYTENEGSVFIGYEEQNGMLVITVKDTGIGIPVDEIDKLFTKFFRARNAQTYQAEGTGLGLAIVKQSAEKLGGGVRVESKEQVGTTFTVELPVGT